MKVQSHDLQALPLLPHYQLVGLLGESLHTRLFKGFAKARPNKLLTLKLLKAPLRQESQRRYMRQKIERLKVIHSPQVLTPIAFECHENAQFIVQELFPGEPLDVWASRQGPIDVRSFFTIAGQLAQALSAVHEAGIIHGGVKPHNILIRPQTLETRLIDFITPIDIREISHFIYDRGFVEGTLAYTSPEQTGRINHRVDFSTDMYSLAIVLYQLLTQTLPFKSTDPLELIHSHLAEEAPLVHTLNPAIPEMVSRIIAKLCLKEPEKRYQSGSGLYADLMRCQEEQRTTGKIAAFKLGLHDHMRRVVFISKMVGRDPEARIIRDEYEKVTKGAFRAIFISGFSGIGKTRLIQELQRPLVEHSGYFTSGKFDQYQKNIPYSSLLQALRNLIRTYLTESDHRVAEWRKKILDAVGQQGRVICDVVPELDILLGAQPDLPPLPPVEARNRFNNVLGRFLACLATEENPLILFVDDLQWCDSATFDFLTYLFADAEEYPFLYFMGAFRHNEVPSDHPLAHLIRDIRARDQQIAEIRVGPLAVNHCHEMVAYILDLPLEETEALAQFVAELTEGNPLFVSESLSYLHNENLLVFGVNGQWWWDIDKIRASEMPENIVDLFGHKVRRLPKEVLDILVFCACMGNRFAAEEVALIKELTVYELFDRLKGVLSLGLLCEQKSDLMFVHDRVQEAVLRLLSPDDRRSIHWQVGTHLLGAASIDASLEQREDLFTLAAHTNLGKPVELDAATAHRLAMINYHAGNKALSALATQAANDYFRQALQLLPADGWERHYRETFSVHQRLAKTELMCGQYEKSEQLINELVGRAADDLDRTEALAEQTTSLSSIGNFIKAIETANRGLAYFTKAIPEDSDEAQRRMQALMEDIHAKHDDVWHTILHMPFTKERKSKIELAFYSELIPDLYMSGLVPQLYLSAAQSTQHCLAGGMDESVIYSFSIMGLNLGEQEKFDLAFKYEDLAHQLCALYPNTFGATRGMNGIVWCNMHSRSHPKTIAAYARKGIQCGKNCGDLYNAGLSYGPLMWNLQACGENVAEVGEVAQECLRFSKKNQLHFSVGLAEAVEAGWVAPMRHAAEPPVAMDEKLRLWESRNHVASAGSYFVLLALSHFYYGRHEEADKALERVNDYLRGLTDNVLKRQWYIFRILNTLRLHRGGGRPGEWPAVHARIRPLVEQVKRWAALGPLLRPYLALVYAEIAACTTSHSEARSSYLDAIDVARSEGYTFLEGVINEALGELLTELGQPTADVYFREAVRLFHECRATGKELHLMERHPACFEEAAGAGTVEPPAVQALAEALVLPSLDVDYLVKASIMLSGQIELDALLDSLMRVTLEVSGAQHGYLLIREHGKWHVHAESHAGDATVRTERRPLEAVSEIAHGLVNFVSRTATTLVLANASDFGDFRHLADVRSLEVRSALCAPIIKQGTLIGILYLENRLAEGMFTPDKVRMIDLLNSFAANALENSRLVATLRRTTDELDELNADLERRVGERTVELEAINRELEAFSYSVSHDLRAPLRAIHGFSHSLLEQHGASLNAEASDLLARVLRASKRMSEVIDDLLKLSMVGRAEMRDVPVDLTSIATELVQNLSKAMPREDMSVTIEPALRTLGDEGLVRTVLENLFSNAWKFTSKQPRPHIHFGLVTGQVETFAIRDNGVGFDPAYRDKLFRPFERLHSPSEYPGTGIGLAIVQRIIHRHGGRIWVEAAPGHGATFFFTLGPRAV